MLRGQLRAERSCPATATEFLDRPLGLRLPERPGRNPDLIHGVVLDAEFAGVAHKSTLLGAGRLADPVRVEQLLGDLYLALLAEAAVAAPNLPCPEDLLVA